MGTSSSVRNRITIALAAAGVMTGAIRDAGAEQQIQWDSNPAKEHRGENGRQIAFTCPRESSPGFAVIQWGTDVYTDDSAICPTAVHAGVITTEGGTVTIEIRPGQSSYQGSTRNGVTTGDWPSFEGSYVFVKPAARTPAAPTPAASTPAAPTPAAPTPAGLTGAWHQQGGGPVAIEQREDQISGSYRGGHDHPDLVGQFSGKLDGRHLVATYDVHEKDLHRTGTLDLTVSEDGTRLEGTYTSADGSQHGNVDWVRGGAGNP